MDQMIKKEPTLLRYEERKVYTKDVNTKNNFNIDVGAEGETTRPKYIIVAFQSGERREANQQRNKGLFDNPPITSSWCTIGSER